MYYVYTGEHAPYSKMLDRLQCTRVFPPPQYIVIISNQPQYIVIIHNHPPYIVVFLDSLVFPVSPWTLRAPDQLVRYLRPTVWLVLCGRTVSCEKLVCSKGNL
jgi:hypothetical protein